MVPRDKVDGYHFLIQFSAQKAKECFFFSLSLSLFFFFEKGDRNRKPQAGERQAYGRKGQKKAYDKKWRKANCT